jgi:hypothetical protein
MVDGGWKILGSGYWAVLNKLGTKARIAKSTIYSVVSCVAGVQCSAVRG